MSEVLRLREAVGAFDLLDKANKAVVNALGQGDGESPFTAIETITVLFPYRPVYSLSDVSGRPIG